jgi:hypothetical protein
MDTSKSCPASNPVRMKPAVLAPQGLAQPAKVAVAIPVIAEAGPAVVATLYDVQRDTVDANAWTPEHKESSRN